MQAKEVCVKLIGHNLKSDRKPKYILGKYVRGLLNLRARYEKQLFRQNGFYAFKTANWIFKSIQHLTAHLFMYRIIHFYFKIV